jgi:hypothetical protein
LIPLRDYDAGGDHVCHLLTPVERYASTPAPATCCKMAFSPHAGSSCGCSLLGEPPLDLPGSDLAVASAAVCFTSARPRARLHVAALLCKPGTIRHDKGRAHSRLGHTHLLWVGDRNPAAALTLSASPSLPWRGSSDCTHGRTQALQFR